MSVSLPASSYNSINKEGGAQSFSYAKYCNNNNKNNNTLHKFEMFRQKQTEKAHDR